MEEQNEPRIAAAVATMSSVGALADPATSGRAEAQQKAMSDAVLACMAEGLCITANADIVRERMEQARQEALAAFDAPAAEA